MSGNRLSLSVLYTAIALCGGLAGGAGSNWLRQSLSPSATAGTPAATVVKATEFDLIDDSGAVRGKLYMADAEEPRLGLYDTSGRETVSLWREVAHLTEEAYPYASGKIDIL